MKKADNCRRVLYPPRFLSPLQIIILSCLIWAKVYEKIIQIIFSWNWSERNEKYIAIIECRVQFLMKLLRDQRIWHAWITESLVSLFFFPQVFVGLSVIRMRRTFYVVCKLKLYFRKRKAEIDYIKKKRRTLSLSLSFWCNITKLNFDCFALKRAECLDMLWSRWEKENPKPYKKTYETFVDVSTWATEIWASLVVVMKISVLSYGTPSIYLYRKVSVTSTASQLQAVRGNADGCATWRVASDNSSMRVISFIYLRSSYAVSTSDYVASIGW
jgi:hypothetical protein